jgi:hypothetical protein
LIIVAHFSPRNRPPDLSRAVRPKRWRNDVLWSPATAPSSDFKGIRETTVRTAQGIAFTGRRLFAWCSFSGETRVHDTRTGNRLATCVFFNAATAVFFTGWPSSGDWERGDGDIKIYHTATWRELITVSSERHGLPTQFSRASITRRELANWRAKSMWRKFNIGACRPGRKPPPPRRRTRKPNGHETGRENCRSDAAQWLAP